MAPSKRGWIITLIIGLSASVSFSDEISRSQEIERGWHQEWYDWGHQAKAQQINRIGNWDSAASQQTNNWGAADAQIKSDGSWIDGQGSQQGSRGWSADDIQQKDWQTSSGQQPSAGNWEPGDEQLKIVQGGGNAANGWNQGDSQIKYDQTTGGWNEADAQIKDQGVWSTGGTRSGGGWDAANAQIKDDTSGSAGRGQSIGGSWGSSVPGTDQLVGIQAPDGGARNDVVDWSGRPQGGSWQAGDAQVKDPSITETPEQGGRSWIPGDNRQGTRGWAPGDSQVKDDGSWTSSGGQAPRGATWSPVDAQIKDGERGVGQGHQRGIQDTGRGIGQGPQRDIQDADQGPQKGIQDIGRGIGQGPQQGIQDGYDQGTTGVTGTAGGDYIGTQDGVQPGRDTSWTGTPGFDQAGVPSPPSPGQAGDTIGSQDLPGGDVAGFPGSDGLGASPAPGLGFEGIRGDTGGGPPRGARPPFPQGNYKGGDTVYPGDDPSQWRLEDSIPGTPGVDYPNYNTVPATSFDCKQQEYPGYYGDPAAQCQVFHICQSDGRHDSFLCPLGTIFNQQYFVCDWWFNFNCADTSSYYGLNADLYKPGHGGNFKGTPFEGAGQPGSAVPGAGFPATGVELGSAIPGTGFPVAGEGSRSPVPGAGIPATGELPGSVVPGAGFPAIGGGPGTGIPGAGFPATGGEPESAGLGAGYPTSGAGGIPLAPGSQEGAGYDSDIGSVSDGLAPSGNTGGGLVPDTPTQIGPSVGQPGGSLGTVGGPATTLGVSTGQGLRPVSAGVPSVPSGIPRGTPNVRDSKKSPVVQGPWRPGGQQRSDLDRGSKRGAWRGDQGAGPGGSWRVKGGSAVGNRVNRWAAAGSNVVNKRFGYLRPEDSTTKVKQNHDKTIINTQTGNWKTNESSADASRRSNWKNVGDDYAFEQNHNEGLASEMIPVSARQQDTWDENTDSSERRDHIISAASALGKNPIAEGLGNDSLDSGSEKIELAPKNVAVEDADGRKNENGKRWNSTSSKLKTNSKKSWWRGQEIRRAQRGIARKNNSGQIDQISQNVGSHWTHLETDLDHTQKWNSKNTHHHR
ncbi:collagen alpha-1(I) chain-like [Stegodyphus dumicola]|uniref:collagen alpha-1(I) chain-like n=1 Tax=Stegodyphus dumicola TaxID=202533 RepID=UPI0015AC4265|nr:collagen alpha-1(I) chain-like [Stegodyphus dumicola]